MLTEYERNANDGYRRTSLYVGDLHPAVTEEMLYTRFAVAGQVQEIRVCRDKQTQESLGYAYVNFVKHEDAKVAMETFNYENLYGKPMRIMWSERNPAARRSGKGNLFVKNIDTAMTTRMLYETFAAFGPILSCKIATDENGLSCGYGFVHFEEASSAQLAINNLHGMEIYGKKLFVNHFLPKCQRQGFVSAKEFNDTGGVGFGNGDARNAFVEDEELSHFIMCARASGISCQLGDTTINKYTKAPWATSGGGPEGGETMGAHHENGETGGDSSIGNGIDADGDAAKQPIMNGAIHHGASAEHPTGGNGDA